MKQLQGDFTNSKRGTNQLVGALVGFRVLRVGSCVGFLVGTSVGSDVGSKVGFSVGLGEGM